MNERIAVTLDFTACKYIPELYKEMRTKMEWDDDFGEDLSALWDILTGMPYKGDDFTIIRPVRFENIPHGQNDIFSLSLELPFWPFSLFGLLLVLSCTKSRW